MPCTTVSHVPRVAQAHAISNDLHEVGLQSAAISVVFPHRQGQVLVQPAPTAPLRPSWVGHHGTADSDLRATGTPTIVPRRASRWLATGPILSIFSGMGLRRMADVLPEALVGLGIPDPEARHFAAAAETGQTLIIVRTDEEICTLLVVEIFRHHGGREIVQFA